MIYKIAILLSSLMLMPSVSIAEPDRYKFKQEAEILRLIRNEKLNLILPGAMRDNKVDMWIHVARPGDKDPMAPHFGQTAGYLIFTDRGDKIERAVFGDPGAVEDIDFHGSSDVAMAFEGYRYDIQDLAVFKEVADFIRERDPKTIAVNTSDWSPIADGISHSQYVKLEKILGPEYSKRIISAEKLITDFRGRRTMREVVGFAHALEAHRRILERALSREVITPGVTTLAEVGWWVKEETFRQGLGVGRYGFTLGVDLPRVLYSAKSKGSRTPDVRWMISGPEYVIQRGDFLTYDIAVRYLDYFSTDFKRNAYITMEGETAAPSSIQHAFDRAIAARDIIRQQVVIGKTAGQTLDDIVDALEKADYMYTPFVDDGVKDYKMIQKKMGKTKKSGFSIDLHAQGNNGGNFVTVGPSISPFRTDRKDLVIPENHFFSLEYMVHTNLPERPGYPISINIEGNHVVSTRGVEFLHPPNESIILIH